MNSLANWLQLKSSVFFAVPPGEGSVLPLFYRPESCLLLVADFKATTEPDFPVQPMAIQEVEANKILAPDNRVWAISTFQQRG